MDPIVSAACDLLAQAQPFVLATIIHQEGSAPRTAGTRMLITPQQKIFGTIGGGILEAETMQAAAQMDGKTPARFLDFDLAHQEAANQGMICGGLVRVLLDYIQPGDENKTLFNAWRSALSTGHRAMLVTTVSSSQNPIEQIDHALLSSDNRVQGRLALNAESRKQLSALVTTATHIQVLNLERSLVVADPGQSAATLFIFGGGHVAQPTARTITLNPIWLPWWDSM